MFSDWLDDVELVGVHVGGWLVDRLLRWIASRPQRKCAVGSCGETQVWAGDAGDDVNYNGNDGFDKRLLLRMVAVMMTTFNSL